MLRYFEYIIGVLARLRDLALGRLGDLRRSVIEVHPKNYGTPSRKELHTSPENRLEQKSSCIPMHNPMSQVYENAIFLNKTSIPTVLG